METSFASRVKEFRKFKGLSQEAFAERCGLEQGNITQMERGTDPKSSNAAKILAGFPDLSPEWLLIDSYEGPMLKDGRALTPASQLPPAVPSKFEEPGTPLRVNREGEDGNYWKQIAQERGDTIELLKQLLASQFPGLAELPGKLVNSEYAAAMLEPVGFRQAGRQLAPSMFLAVTGHKYEWVDAALGQPLTVEASPLKKTA